MAEFIVDLSPATLAYLEERAAFNLARGKGAATPLGCLVEEVEYAQRRRAALAKDAHKEKLASANGPVPEVQRRRYQPRRPSPAYTAPEVPQEVRDWAADAPVAHGGRRQTVEGI